jgi:hypothetical protein
MLRCRNAIWCDLHANIVENHMLRVTMKNHVVDALSAALNA